MLLFPVTSQSHCLLEGGRPPPLLATTSFATRESSRLGESQSPARFRRRRSGATCHLLRTQRASLAGRSIGEKRPSHPPPPRHSRRSGAICRLRRRHCAPQEDRRLQRKQTGRAGRQDHLRTGCRNTGRSRARRSHWGSRDKVRKDRHIRSMDCHRSRQSTVRASKTRDRIRIRSRANRIHPNPGLDPSLCPNLDPSPCHSIRFLGRNRRSPPDYRHTLC